MARDLYFGALGPLEVTTADGGTLHLGRRRQRSVLALLLVHANHVVSIDRLVDQLWGDKPPENVLNSLHPYISHLRRALEPERAPRAPPTVLLSRPTGYLLRVHPERFDVTLFEHRLDEARRIRARDPLHALDLLCAAVALWRGQPYEEFAYAGFASMEVARLLELRVAALEDRFEIELAIGRSGELVAELERLVGEHPLRERLRGQLMLALYRSGRQREALAVYQDLRRTLADELGLDPSRDVQRLESAILAQDPSLETTRPATAELAAERPAAVAPARDLRAPPLVGRTAELRHLQRLLAAAAAGGGRLALVEGEAGIGKSRLVDALLERARTEGFGTLLGRCFEGDGAPPFWPWIQVFDDLLRSHGPGRLLDAAGQHAGALAVVAPQLSGSAPLTALDVGGGRFRASAAVTAVLMSVATEVPLVVALDDLHWADPDSLRTLVLLSQGIGAARILLMGTYRPGDADAASSLRHALGQLARHGTAERVRLSQLDRSEVDALITGATGLRPSPAVVDAVHERTSGNPFFVVELARLLQAAGAVADVDGGLAGMGVPAGVSDVLRSRVHALPRTGQKLIEAAAVSGREFDVDVVASAARLGVEPALAELDGFARAGLVTDGERPGSYRFAHALLSEAVGAGLTAPRRALLHRRVAEAIDRHHGEDPLRFAALAHHVAGADPASDPAWAVPLLRRAAQLAARALAFSEAEELHRRQLELTRLLPGAAGRARSELEALVDLAVILTWTRGYHAPEVGATVEQALDLAASGGAVVSIAAAMYARWSHHCLRAEFDAADAIAADLQELAGNHDDPVLAFVAGLVRAVGAWGRGRIRDSLRAFASVEARVRDVSDPALARVVLVAPPVIFGAFHGICRTIAGDVDHGARSCEEAVRYARSTGQEWSLAYALVFGQALAGAMAGDAALASRSAEEGLARSQAHRFTSLVPLAGVVAGWAGAVSGGGTRALDGAIAAAEALTRAGAPALRHFLLGLIAEGHLVVGHPRAALEATEEAIGEAARVGERFWLAELHRLRACALQQTGSPGSPEARDLARRIALEQGSRLIVARLDAELVVRPR